VLKRVPAVDNPGLFGKYQDFTAVLREKFKEGVDLCEDAAVES
jgi:hypothetical protein